MVFVWSRLPGGDPGFTLSRVALNDSIMVRSESGLLLAEAPVGAWLARMVG